MKPDERKMVLVVRTRCSICQTFSTTFSLGLSRGDSANGAWTIMSQVVHYVAELLPMYEIIQLSHQEFISLHRDTLHTYMRRTHKT